MSAAEFNITLEEGSDFTKDFTYRDQNGDPIDVSNYGGSIHFAKEREEGVEPWAEGDHNDGWVQIGNTDGKIIIQVPHTAYNNLNEEQKEGAWELYIFPTASDPNDRPKRILEGTYDYSPSLRTNT